MERHPICMDLKISNCLDGNTPQIDLQMQHNPHQNYNRFLCINWQVFPKIHVEIKESQNRQNDLKKITKLETHISPFQNSVQ